MGDVEPAVKVAGSAFADDVLSGRVPGQSGDCVPAPAGCTSGVGSAPRGADRAYPGLD